MNPNFQGGWGNQPMFQQYQTMPPQAMYGFQQPQPNYEQASPALSPPAPPLKVKLDPKERGLYSLLLSQADPESKGRLEGAQVVEFFKRSNLSTDILKDIWTICTPNGESFLDRERFYVALRLIALAQEGKSVSPDSIFNNTPAGLPNFKSTAVIKDRWELEDDDKDKYEKLFNQFSGGKGFLTAEEAYAILSRTGAKSEYLSKIWNLCDPNDTGELIKNQFLVALHLATRVKLLSEPVPDEIPAALKKVFLARLEPEFKSIDQPKSEAFAEFGLAGPQGISHPQTQAFQAPAQSNLGFQQENKDSFGFGFKDQFQTMPSKPIKLNLEKSNESSMIKKALKQPDLFEAKIQQKSPDQSFEFQATPLKEDLLEDSDESRRSHVRTSSHSKIRNEPLHDGKANSLYKRNDDLTTKLKEVEDEIQEKLREWRDVRSRLSLERERNQVLSSRLEEMNAKMLQETFQISIKSFKI